MFNMINKFLTTLRVYDTAALKKSEADKAALARKLANVTNIEPDDETISDREDAPLSSKKKSEPKIPRPVGDFNIQEAMVHRK